MRVICEVTQTNNGMETHRYFIDGTAPNQGACSKYGQGRIHQVSDLIKRNNKRLNIVE